MSASSTRRGLLGIIATAPIAASAAASPAAAFTACKTIGVFDARLIAYRRAEATLNAVSIAFSKAEVAFSNCRPDRPGPSYFGRDDTVDGYNARVAAEKASYARACKAAEDAHNLGWHRARQRDACVAAGEALDELIGTPAPNLVAAATKLEIAMAEGLEISELAPLLTDLRQLAGRAA